MKGAFEAKIKEIVKKMEVKEAAKARQEEIEALKEEMDRNFREKEVYFADAVQKKDTERHWELWCKAVEDPYVNALDLEEKEAKKMRGRGEVKVIQRIPLPRGNEDKHVRNKWSYEARRDLKQARRCEQVVYRARCMFEPEDEARLIMSSSPHGLRSRSRLWARTGRRLGVARPRAM